MVFGAPRAAAATAAIAEQEQAQLAGALALRRPLILFFKSAGCSLCRSLEEAGDLEAAAAGVPIAPITTDDQAAWAPEVRGGRGASARARARVPGPGRVRRHRTAAAGAPSPPARAPAPPGGPMRPHAAARPPPQMLRYGVETVPCFVALDARGRALAKSGRPRGAPHARASVAALARLLGPARSG
jgi:hypothetical protein